MPSAPAGSNSQKEVLGNLVDLAQTASVDAVNQIALVDRQITDMDNASELFQKRYNFWHKYVSNYEREKALLGGLALNSPLPYVDRASYPLTGNDYSDFAYGTTSRLESNGEDPVRIAEFDGGGPTHLITSYEVESLAQEESARDILCNGFNSGAIVGNVKLSTAITPSNNEFTLESTFVSASVSLGRVYIGSGSNSCIANIVEVEEQPPSGSGNPTYWDIKVEYITNFTSIPANAPVVSNLPGFNNSERTSKVATIPSRQGIFDVLMTMYEDVISNWADILEEQHLIVVMPEEDMEDAAYNTALEVTKNFLSSWVSSPQFDDITLAGIVTKSNERDSLIPVRTSWINQRLSDSGAYNERFNYVKLMFNRAIGSYMQWLAFKKQRDVLSAQQPILAQRAATYQAEVY